MIFLKMILKILMKILNLENKLKLKVYET